MNFGILGCGNIAHRFVKGLKESDKGVLKAVASQSQDRLEAFTKRYDVKGYLSYTELLEDESIDVVYIATYNPSHKALIELCLKYEKHVICEKPMLRNVKDTRDMFALAAKNGCFLMEAQKAVFLPIYDDIERWIPMLGTPLVVRADYAKNANHPMDHWVRDPYFGGSMKDVGCYPLSVVHHLFGSEYDDIHHQFMLGDRGAEDVGVVTFLRENLSMSVIGSYEVTLDNELRISGPNGYISAVDFWKTDRVEAYIDGEYYMVEYPHESEFTYYINHVVECIREGLLESPVMSESASVFCIEHANPSEVLNG